MAGRVRAVSVAAAASLLLASLVAAQSTVLEVFTLKHRTAQQVIPVIQSVLKGGGSVSGLQNQLVVRTTPGNLEEIRRILASVDVLPRRLLISVKQDADAATGQRTAEISGSGRVDDGATVSVTGSGGHGDDGLRARVIDTRRAQADRAMHTVQVLEGSVAFIRIGQSVPVPRQQVLQTLIGGQVVSQVVDNVEYRDVGSGFHVLPRVAGERVTLDINPQHDTLDHRLPGAVNVQRVATTVSGRLGEWIEIAGLDQDRSRERSVLLGRASSGASDTRRILVKVEELK